MKPAADAAEAPAMQADMFSTSPRLAPVLPLLRVVPRTASSVVLAALAIADGVVRGRFAEARDWAAGLGHGRWKSRWTALRLLANHGRAIADEAMLGVCDPVEDAASMAIEGADRLRAVTSGALLLGFHLGPPRIWLGLRAAGLPVRMVARFEESRRDARWAGLIEAGEVIALPRDEAGRLQALYRIRSLLANNALVCIPADGIYGREAFRIDLPGRPMIVRGGWLALRRQLRVPVFPVLARAEGRRRVVTIHPPLPPVQRDAAADVAHCRDALAPLLADYVGRYPTQCRYLAFPPWKE
jgi:lauroyl/myristoyl acyltransferase